MEQTYFLGANSKHGFYSLYDSFPGEGAFLHIIKSGPGTGKSSFMRRLGQAAAERGLDVEYILCSGDPSSLDGVYIPALGIAWVDGTAPHITEPTCFGVDADYVNLGKFLRKRISAKNRQKILELNRAYKALYQRAYSYLASAGELRQAMGQSVSGLFDAETAHGQVDEILGKSLGEKTGDGRLHRRFLSAVSCVGELHLSEEVSKLCKLVYRFDGCPAFECEVLKYAAKAAMQRGAEVICCPSPLTPEEPEALLIPEAGLAFVGSGWEFPGARKIRSACSAPAKAQQALRTELREAGRAYDHTMLLACRTLGMAKALHDELEEIYKVHMDFPALTKYTDAEIRKLLK